MWWWWWWLWVAAIFLFLFLPLSYGWGRRDWGPPYPTYYRRRYYARRGTTTNDPTVPPTPGRTATLTAPPETDYQYEPGHRWSWVADLFWLAVLAAIAWAIYLWVT